MAIVEQALGLTILVLLIFGIIEMGYLFHDQSCVVNAAREAARAAAAGDKPDLAKSLAMSRTGGLVTNNLGFTLQYSTDGTTYSTLQDDTTTSPTSNTASGGDLIKVTVTYTHNYITSVLTSRSVTLKSVAVVRRES